MGYHKQISNKHMAHRVTIQLFVRIIRQSIWFVPIYFARNLFHLKKLNSPNILLKHLKFKYKSCVFGQYWNGAACGIHFHLELFLYVLNIKNKEFFVAATKLLNFHMVLHVHQLHNAKQLSI